MHTNNVKRAHIRVDIRKMGTIIVLKNEDKK